MDCPQCGGTLSTYALRGREASVCEDCGYVGIDAEHRGEARRVESWDDALRRFYRAHDSDADPTVEVRPPLARPGGDSANESWDDALRRFYARQPRADAPDRPDDRSADDNEGAVDGLETAGEERVDGDTGNDEASEDAGETATDGEATTDRTDAEEKRRVESEPAGRDADRSVSRPESQSSAGDS